MFLRLVGGKKGSGRYWALVESHRGFRGPRQQVVAYLGDVSEEFAQDEVDVVMPPKTGPEIRRRCISIPEQPLAQLLQKLKITLPRNIELQKMQ